MSACPPVAEGTRCVTVHMGPWSGMGSLTRSRLGGSFAAAHIAPSHDGAARVQLIRRVGRGTARGLDLAARDVDQVHTHRTMRDRARTLGARTGAGQAGA